MNNRAKSAQKIALLGLGPTGLGLAHSALHAGRSGWRIDINLDQMDKFRAGRGHLSNMTEAAPAGHA